MYVYDEDYILHLFSRKLIYAKDILDSKFNLILNADHQSLFCKNNDKSRQNIQPKNNSNQNKDIYTHILRVNIFLVKAALYIKTGLL